MRHLLLVCSALALATPAHSAAFIRLIPFTDTLDLRDAFGGRQYRNTTRAITGRPFSNGTAPGIANSGSGNRQQPFQAAAVTGDPAGCAFQAVSGSPNNPIFQIPGLPGDLGLDAVLTNQNVLGDSRRPGAAGNCYLTFANWNHPVFGRQFTGALNVNFRTGTARYVGLTIGSLDEYNVLSVLPQSVVDPDDPEEPLFAQAADGTIIGAFPTKFVTGAELATAFGVPLYEDYYVEIRSDTFLGQLRLATTNLAFEIDGIATSTARNISCIYASNPQTSTWSAGCADAAPTRRKLPAPINVRTLPGAPQYVLDANSPFLDYTYNNGVRPGVTDNISVGDQQQVVPAPAALALFGLGFAGLVTARRRAR